MCNHWKAADQLGCVGLTGRYCRITRDTKGISVQLTITAAIHARWGHRVDHLIHTHAWEVEATVEGDIDAEKVFPADDLEAILRDTVEPWAGRYLTSAEYPFQSPTSSLVR